MPTFTLELWRVIDLKPDAVDTDAWLGLNDYPIFNEDYRATLNEKIKRHFMFQEIGHETVEQFTYSMRRKMHEIMPLYNELYKSTLMTYDPFKTIDMRTVSTGVSEQESEGASESLSDSNIDAKSKNVASAFPQVQLAGNKDYATTGADANSQTETKGSVSENSNARNTSNNEAESATSGYQGNPSELIQAYRAAILNVDLMVIAEVDPLFMGIWNTGDDYTTTQIGRYLH